MPVGWAKAHYKPFEVGCRGFAGKSFHRVLGLQGISGMHRRRVTKDILETAEKGFKVALVEDRGGMAYYITWTQAGGLITLAGVA